MARSQYIARSGEELKQALAEDLQILREELVDIPNAIGIKPYRIKVIAVVLRLLVADGARDQNGLLSLFANKYAPSISAEMEAWLDGPFASAKKGSDKGEVEWKLSPREMIVEESQRRGLAHEDVVINQASAFLDLGISGKTNPRLGLFIGWGNKILGYGNEVIKVLQAN